MDLPLGIKPLSFEAEGWTFTNAHANFRQKLKKGSSFELTVSDPEFKATYTTFKDRYNKTTENIQWLIQYAIDHQIRLRAMGSGWSFSKVAVCEDGIINTKKLRLKAQLAASQLAPAYLDQGGDPTNLLFAQCGNSIIEVNDLLEKERQPAKSLRASGGSNGQTIVGAFSTGTHGAAFKFGPLANFIVGMHLIVGPDRHVWLERASYPVTSPAFHDWIRAEVIRDDELFHSALVSFGSFGFIHSVLLEVEPVFLLEQEFKTIPYDEALETMILTGDFSAIAPRLKYPLPQINDTLYHLELAINPHHFKKGDPDQGAYLRVMYKQPYRTDYVPFKPETEGYTYGDDVLGLMQTILDKIEVLPGKLEVKLIPKLVNSLFKLAYDRPATAMGTVGETFRNTIFRGKLFSAGFAFDRKDIPQLIDLILAINHQRPFAGVMAMRFVKGTLATLGFTRFDNTCVLELDGADTKSNHEFVRLLAETVEAQEIPYAVHWGKITTMLTPERVRKMYGDQAVDRWLRHRAQLLSEPVRKVFMNGFLETCGLDQTPSEPIHT
ncbi:FAD-linked oxidase [Larkinella sp. VNQ87]|uniref:FAD-linked oxidase n=1 Tax=Larkinella sp. VNQ87 TaxID=3400921 RepID=UPI003C121FB1